MDGRHKNTFLRPISRRLNNLGSNALRRSAEAILRPDSNTGMMNGEAGDSMYDDDNLAPVMPAIDAVQQLMDEENRNKLAREKLARRKKQNNNKVDAIDQDGRISNSTEPMRGESSKLAEKNPRSKLRGEGSGIDRETEIVINEAEQPKTISDEQNHRSCSLEPPEDEECLVVRNNPFNNFTNPQFEKKQEEYEFIPKSVILDVYSNDPEVKRFLKQLPRIGNEFGYNEQDYKCYSCRRPIGMVFGQSRLCHFDGHHYCSECHLGEKSIIPARILCNWDFTKYPISKRNQHFLTLISNEPMFELKTMAPLLYKTCPELREIEELRCQAFFIRSYCFTCVQDSISFELTKLVWPREHLIKQIDLYSLEDFIQIKSGALKNVLKNVITFGRQHVLSCMLCCQKGFICELCKSSQIIYPFDTESVYRCNSCQSIYHKNCFKSKPSCDACPRCQRLKARRTDS